jgi:hypothetical protein
MTFVQPALEITPTPGEIVCIVLFLVLVAVSLKEVVFNFFKKCHREVRQEDEELYGKYAVQFGEDYDATLLVINENETIFKQLCLAAKMHEYFSAEESSKIVSFSAFRILAVPLALYGYLFYLCNIASYNYSSFGE